MEINDLRNMLDSALRLTWEKAGQAGQVAKAGAAKATQAAKAGAAKATQTADNIMTYTRLKNHIRELNNQIDDRLKAIGEMVYATHSGNPGDTCEMERILVEIDGFKRSLAEDEQALAALRNLRTCPGCGTPNPAEHVYCEECGYPLWPEDSASDS